MRGQIYLRVYALCGLLSVLSTQTRASLLVDLRFSPNTPAILNAHTALLYALGGTYTVQVWAQVRGTNTTGTDDSLRFLYGSIQSQQVGGLGAILAGTSGVSGNSGLGPIFTTASPGQPGVAQNTTADLVMDWGTTSGTNSIKYNSTLSAGNDYAFFGTPGVTANLLGEGLAGAGVEIEVGQFLVTVNAFDVNHDLPASTLFNWVKGTAIIPPSHDNRIDGNLVLEETSLATYLLSSNPGNSVTFVIDPEPGSAMLFGFSLLGLVLRRQKGACMTYSESHW